MPFETGVPSGPGVIIDVLVDIHNARHGPPSGVPEQPGYRGPGDVIYDQRQAPTPTEDVVSSGILDTPYTQPPDVFVNPSPSPSPITNTPSSPPPVEGVVVPPPADVYHDYEGYYDPHTEPAPEYRSGVIIEGEVAQPAGEPHHETPSAWSIGERIAGGLIGRLARRIGGELIGGPIGAILQEIIQPTELPPEPDVRVPTPVMLPPSAVRLPRTPMPTPAPLPRGARPPTVPAPTPDIGAKPWAFDSQPPTPQTPPSSPSAPATVSTQNTSVPQPATSSQPAPQSSAPQTSSPAPSPRWQFDPLPAWLASLQRSRAPSAGITTAASTAAPSAPAAVSAPASAPTSSPVPSTVTSTATQNLTGSAAPPLTPVKAADLQFPPGESCETPGQQKQRRQRQRENCNRFVTITIPKHRRRVCVAEAAHHLGKHLGKELGRAITDKLGITKPKRESKGKQAKLRVSKRGGISYGGYGVTIPKQMRPRPPGGVPRL